MTTETVTIDLSAAKQEPSLEEQAKAAGIDVEGIDPNATAQTAKSEKILGKFENYDALEAAYKELEKKLGTPHELVEDTTAQRTEPEAKTETKTETNTADTQQQQNAEEAVTKAGLDLNEVSQRYWDNGEKLDPADYEKLDKAGYPKGIVDQFIEGVNASRTLARQAVFNTVGGEENYTSMLEWAKASFSTDEVRAYNDAVNSGDQAKTMFAVNGLKARYEATNGNEPTNTVAARAGRADGGRFDSIAQLMEAMRDPKYNSDPAYRRTVEQKLSRSDIM